MIFEKLFQCCKTQVRYNTKVQAIDYSGQIVRLYTTNGQYTAKKVISSLPLGVLQQGKVQFIPLLPPSIQSAISSIGNGNEEKLFCLFRRPFWETK
jgi:monoamine oxidase